MSDTAASTGLVGTRLDLSACGVVVTCTDCPGWREHRPSSKAAARVRAEHERQVHGEFRGSGARQLVRVKAGR